VVSGEFDCSFVVDGNLLSEALLCQLTGAVIVWAAFGICRPST
jgi:hypothetical protein